MNKIWKIGTSIQTYIDEILALQKSHGNNFELKHDGSRIKLIFHDGHVVVKTKATCSQFMRVLISLSIISSNVSYRYDKSVLMGAEYSILSLNKGESIGSYMALALNNKIKLIFEENESKFPSEEIFVFSLAASFFAMQDKKNSKYINMRLSLSKIEDVAKYYSKTAKLILDSDEAKILIRDSAKYIIGFNENIKEIITSINGSPSEKLNGVYSKTNLNGSLITEPHTFGAFMKQYFTDKTFISIPVYQRKYIWAESTLKTLMNDIKNIDKFMTHYIGNIVVKRKNEGNNQVYRIVDGQQRITTLFIITRALFDFSKYKNYPIDKMINDKFAIFDGEDNFINQTFLRIEGNDDYEAFRLVMRGEAFNKDSKLYPSQITENYKSAIEWFSSQMKSKDDVSEYWDKLINSLIFVLINAEGSEEYKLFEKLNTGATPLTTLELFKNYVLDAFSKKIVDEKIAQSLFNLNIEQQFLGKNRNINAEKFMVSYLRVNNSIISDETIFNQFKDSIEQKYILNNPDSDLEYVLSELGNEIKLYNTISVYSEYRHEDSFAYLYSDFLFMLDGRTVYYPIIIRLIKSIFEDYKTPQIDEVNLLREYLRVIEIFEVRLQVAAYRGQSLSSKVEAILVSMNDKTTPNELWELFSAGSGTTGMPTVNELSESLKTKSIANKPARLIMTRIENYYIMNKGWNVDKEDHSFSALYKKPSQREHLLPTKWTEFWKEYLKSKTKLDGEELSEYVNKYVDFIGNAFAIPAWSNNTVKNHSLEEKIRKFEKTSYSKQVKMFTGIKGKLDPIKNDFGPSEIIKRSESIAKIAEEIWADYKK